MLNTGQKVKVQLFIDGKPIGPETTEKPQLGFSEVRLEMKVEPGHAFDALIANIDKQLRAQHQRALAEHILAGGWVGCIVLSGDGHSQVYLARVLRMVAAPYAPGYSVTQELYRASLDDGYNPDPAAQRAGPPLPTPTLDEVMDQLARSTHPWVAMEVNASGCVDTIIYPKGAAEPERLVVR